MFVEKYSKNSRITKDCLTLKRPIHGMYYKDINKVLGLSLQNNLYKDMQISLKDFKPRNHLVIFQWVIIRMNLNSILKKNGRN